MIPKEPISLGVVLLGIVMVVMVLTIIVGALLDVGTALDKAWKDQQKMKDEKLKNASRKSDDFSNRSGKPKSGNSRGPGKKSGTRC